MISRNPGVLFLSLPFLAYISPPLHLETRTRISTDRASREQAGSGFFLKKKERKFILDYLFVLPLAPSRPAQAKKRLHPSTDGGECVQRRLRPKISFFCARSSDLVPLSPGTREEGVRACVAEGERNVCVCARMKYPQDTTL